MRRIGAAICDLFLVMIFSLLIALVLLGKTASVFLIYPLLFFLYSVLFDLSDNRRTFGKKLMGIKVELCRPVSRLKFALFHSFGKTVFYQLGIFAILALLCQNGGLPYDHYLGLKQTYRGCRVRLAKNGAAVRRVGAAWLDLYVMTLLCFPIVVIEILMALPRSMYFWTAYGALILVCVAYIFCCDYLFDGITVGKKISGLTVEFTGQISRIRFALFHTLCKCIAMPFYMISLLVFVCCGGKMPYDRWLKMRIVEKHQSSE